MSIELAEPTPRSTTETFPLVYSTEIQTHGLDNLCD